MQRQYAVGFAIIMLMSILLCGSAAAALQVNCPDVIVAGEQFYVTAADPDAGYACIGVYQFLNGTCIGFSTRNGSQELTVTCRTDAPAGSELQLMIVARADTQLTTYVGMSYADVAAAFAGRPMEIKAVSVVDSFPVMYTTQNPTMLPTHVATMLATISPTPIDTQTPVPGYTAQQMPTIYPTSNVTTLTPIQEQNIIDQILLQLKMLLGL